MRNFCFLALGAFACGVSPGCGDGRPQRVPVSGKVLIDGQPLTFGYVQFIPENARPSQGEIGPDGSFTLTCFDGGDGAVPGTHKISVLGVEPLGASGQKWHAPPKYRDPVLSGLTETITGSTKNVVIELSWDGDEPFVEKFNE